MYDSASRELATSFLERERPKKMDENEFQKHTDILAQFIHDTGDMYRDYDDEWKKAKAKPR